ncbi:MAG: hypothetical protein ACXAB7_18930 [Candidatus Kariarchaeaceae archaeon]
MVVAIFWIVLIFISTRINLSNIGILVTPLIAVWRTDRLNRIFHQLSSDRFQGFWKKISNGSLFLTILLFFTFPLLLLINLLLAFFGSASPILHFNPIELVNVDTLTMIIPALFFSLLIRLLIQGCVATSYDLKVKQVGMMIIAVLFIPIIQFDREESSLFSKIKDLRIKSIGITISLLLIPFLLLLAAHSGALLDPFFGDSNGALIIGMDPGSPADEVNLKRGDIITGVKQLEFQSITFIEDVNSTADLIAILRKIPPNTQFILITKRGDIPIRGNRPSAGSKIIAGSDIGIYMRDYKPPQMSFLSPFIPYWVELSILWAININLVLSLYNLLPFPFSYGKDVLENLVDQFSTIRRQYMLRAAYLFSGILTIGNIYVTIF